MRGLGLLDLRSLADKISCKWIVRSVHFSDFWAHFLHRGCGNFSHQGLESLSKVLPFLESLAPFKAKGTTLATQFWNAWFKHQDYIILQSNKDLLYLPYDSIWFYKFIPSIKEEDFRRAHKLFKKGYYN